MRTSSPRCLAPPCARIRQAQSGNQPRSSTTRLRKRCSCLLARIKIKSGNLWLARRRAGLSDHPHKASSASVPLQTTRGAGAPR